MFYIVVYDTPSNKRRRRLRQHLKNFIFHVQKSVFEGHLPLLEYRKMLPGIEKIMNSNEDSVRIYQIPKDTFGRIKIIGLPPLTKNRPFHYVGEGEREMDKPRRGKVTIEGTFSKGYENE